MSCAVKSTACFSSLVSGLKAAQQRSRHLHPSPSGFPPTLRLLPPASSCAGPVDVQSLQPPSRLTPHSHRPAVKRRHRDSHNSRISLPSQAYLLSSSLPLGIHLSPVYPTLITLPLLKCALPPKTCSSPPRPLSGIFLQSSPLFTSHINSSPN